MRVKHPEPFDKDREYKIGERFTYMGKTLVAVKYRPVPRRMLEKYPEIYFGLGMMPTQCGMCAIKYKDCNGLITAPCQKWERKDRKHINFIVLRFNKNERK